MAIRRVTLPNPADYGISPGRGFLSPDAPAKAFQNPYYEPWDAFIPRLSALIASGDLEKEVERLPLLACKRLIGQVEYRRAYVVLAFLIHGYVWCRSPPNQRVPSQLGDPFLEACAHLRMEPVVSYAGLCSWNWRIREGGGMTLENMDTLASFTGTRGEAAFYHIPVLVEAEGGHLVHLLLGAIDAAQCGQTAHVIEALKETTNSLVRMSSHLSKFHGLLDPHFFYHELRPFMAGGNGMEEKGLPQGMILQKSDGTEVPLKHVGGSAAQSSLFPFLDYALRVMHQHQTVFEEMRSYMPGAHRDFLDEMSRVPSLREFLEARPSELELTNAYNDCLQQLKSWRGKHIAVVSKYIVQPAREVQQASQVDTIETTGPAETDKEWELQGTGGSALVPFLRQAKDDTVGVSIKLAYGQGNHPA